jgi:cyclopropane fatty-acyl-phospholipid synthase-like methyltransferase
MTEKADDNIQSVEVKDQFGSKYQKYFKTMNIDDEVKEGGMLYSKVAQRRRDKLDNQEPQPMDFNSSVVD